MSPVYLDVEQGTRAWHEARLGIPTASNFKRLITPAGKISKSTGPYMAELLAEHFSGEPFADFENEWTEHGKMYEEEARNPGTSSTTELQGGNQHHRVRLS